jgi:hypothetical protein
MNYSLQGIRFTLKNASIFLIVYYEQFFFCRVYIDDKILS